MTEKDKLINTLQDAGTKIEDDASIMQVFRSYQVLYNRLMHQLSAEINKEKEKKNG